MAGPPSEIPSERDAARLVELALGQKALHAERFATGLAHYVYEVVTESGRSVVARIARDHPRSIAHAVAWSERLRPLGVPLPALLHADAEARLLAWPSMLLERLPGTDLGHAYPALSAAQKADIARGVCAAQALVQGLPPAQGYGFASSDEGPFLPKWQGVVEASLARSRARVSAAGVVDPAHVERVAELVPSFERHFAAIPPRPFMDDTTTKNVIVDGGRLAGIVDVDGLCFGDPLYTVALTRASLLNLRFDLAYVQAWCEQLAPSREAYGALELYTALFLVDFLSEEGQRFNRVEAPVDSARIAHLEGLLAASLRRLGGSQR